MTQIIEQQRVGERGILSTPADFILTGRSLPPSIITPLQPNREPPEDSIFSPQTLGSIPDAKLPDFLRRKSRWKVLVVFRPGRLISFCSLIITSNFYKTLNIAWNYQNYAIEQMESAREHRGELMQLTKMLQQTTQELERANVQLRHARNLAEEARRLKALFAANVSHELRTPINLIVGFTEMMVKSPQIYEVPLPSSYWNDIYTVYRSAKHLQNLINDVLDISQITAGQMAVVKEQVDPCSVIIEAANMVRVLIESKGLEFKTIIPDSLPILLIDQTRIRQIILNLLNNAVRFTERGNITLQVIVDATHLKIRVADTGTGIPPEDLERVFEEFHQLDSSLSKPHGGTGLGFDQIAACRGLFDHIQIAGLRIPQRHPVVVFGCQHYVTRRPAGTVPPRRLGRNWRW